MADLVDKGTWVEIRRVVLGPGERAPQVPENTQQVPLEMRVKGFLFEPVRLGEEAQIVTSAGRRLRGILMEINPAYVHGFGPPIPALSTIGGEVRALLHARRRGP
ncbi:MAG: 2-amino-4-oxopentanoate thiolase subunit OrtA [Alphaproteobacteria bacterium]|nr:2-amino-4-oxopentanoate thiolase subunit OrtA [Alphaproteobacteria bacterium]